MIADALTPEERDKYLRRGKVPETWGPDFSPVGRWKKERVGYPTQKPLALLDRVIRASSNEGDTILDPFCGCATTLVAADRLNRQWIGIDVSAKAVELVTRRIKDDQGLFQHVIARQDVPPRTCHPVQTWGNFPTTPATRTLWMANRLETAKDAASTSSAITWKLTISSPERKAAQTISTTCNYGALIATASKATVDRNTW